MTKTTATLFFALLWSLAGCANASSRPEIQSVVATVAGHTHRAVIRYQDVENGRDRFSLDESAGHHHEFHMDPEARSFLLLRAPVSVTSSHDAGHAHTVTLSVADD